MKTTTKTAIAFIALATTLSGAALADGKGREGKGHERPNFTELDVDKSGGINFDEFFAMASKRIQDADADGNGAITVEEIVAQMGDRGSERRAKRMIERMDMDEDGSVTLEEMRNRTEKQFAMMDRNDDGEIQETEMPKRGKDGKGKGKDGERKGKDGKKKMNKDEG